MNYQTEFYEIDCDTLEFPNLIKETQPEPEPKLTKRLIRTVADRVIDSIYSELEDQDNGDHDYSYWDRHFMNRCDAIADYILDPEWYEIKAQGGHLRTKEINRLVKKHGQNKIEKMLNREISPIVIKYFNQYD
jgi:hypothetical protein